jgi:hypothetical protein
VLGGPKLSFKVVEAPTFGDVQRLFIRMPRQAWFVIPKGTAARFDTASQVGL